MASLFARIRKALPAGGWRDAWYLVISFWTGIAGFTIITTAASTAGGLAVLVIGLPIAVLVARFDRWWCGHERRRAARVLGHAVPGVYEEPNGRGWFGRQLSLLRDRQTWLDGAWMLSALPLGIVGFVTVMVFWSLPFGLLFSPTWLWSIHGWIHRHDVLLSILFPLLAVPAVLFAAWIVRGWALVQAGVAARLLAPRRAELLEQRVQTLSETRAGAVDAAVGELARVERDLHDGAQARLVALAMDLGLAEQRLAGADPDTAREHLAAARGQARAAMAELRDLVRGIAPGILNDRGLEAALSPLISGANPTIELKVELLDRPSRSAETAAYFVVAEALTNVRKHAHASKASVHIYDIGPELLIAEITDDGIGGADPDGGTGLAGMRKRVAAIDGSLTVISPVGGPTTVRAELPCGS